jgi:hypothetical protein
LRISSIGGFIPAAQKNVSDLSSDAPLFFFVDPLPGLSSLSHPASNIAAHAIMTADIVVMNRFIPLNPLRETNRDPLEERGL